MVHLIDQRAISEPSRTKTETSVYLLNIVKIQQRIFIYFCIVRPDVTDHTLNIPLTHAILDGTLKSFRSDDDLKNTSAWYSKKKLNSNCNKAQKVN